MENNHNNEPNAETDLPLVEQLKEKRRKNKKSRKDKQDKDEVHIDQDKLTKALEKEEQNKIEADKLLQMDERKRAYHSKYDEGPITTEEVEAYQIKR